MESNNSSSNALIKASAGASSPSPLLSGHLVSPIAASPRKTPSPSPVSTLLDMYEIEWITTKLELLIKSSSSSFSSPSPGNEPNNLRRMGRKNSCRKGFGFESRFGHHATSLCGSNMEAVIATTSKRDAKRCDLRLRPGFEFEKL